MSSPEDSAARRHADGLRRLQFGIPVYADPDVGPEIWAGVLSLPPGSVVIVNPDSGSGGARDARYAERVAHARAAGLEVLGYVDTAYGERPSEVVLADLDRYLSWYGVGGVFFDQVSGAAAQLGHYRALTEAARSRDLTIALNMGGSGVDPGYGEIADILGVFEGPSEAYATATFPAWMAKPGRRARLWHLVFDVRDEPGMHEAMARARAYACDVVFVTDGREPNPWDHLPHYWGSERGHG